MKKAYTLIELLAVIIILAIISAIAYPRIIDIIGASKIGAYNSAKDNIIESAKLKYLADVNSAVVTEYSVLDLIDQGYLNKDAKNPLTNKDYDEKTKVLITKENGEITYDYIEGDTLYDLVSLKNSDDGVYKEGSNYIYKGRGAKNYISFSEETYRIVRVDSYRNVYLLKEEDNKQVQKDNIDEYINSYYNDIYDESTKKKIISIGLLDYETYKNTFIDNDSYISNNNNIWLKDKDGYKVLSYLTNNLNNENKATTRFIIKLSNSLIITGGEGTQLSPYIVQE